MRYEDFWYNYTLREFHNAVEGYLGAEKSRDIRTALIVTSIENKPVYGYKIPFKTADKRFPELFKDDNKIPEQDELEKLRDETWGPQQ